MACTLTQQTRKVDAAGRPPRTAARVDAGNGGLDNSDAAARQEVALSAAFTWIKLSASDGYCKTPPLAEPFTTPLRLLAARAGTGRRLRRPFLRLTKP